MNHRFDINRFCAKNDIRSYLAKPIVHGGFVYATNGHICVRVPATEADIDTPLDGEQPAKVLASMQKMFAEQQDQRPADLPDLSAVKRCADCAGKGSYLGVSCGTCDGDGGFERDGHDYTCKSCDGDGHLKSDGEENSEEHSEEHSCPHCRGYGYPFASIPVGDSFFQQAYLKLLEPLPGLKAFTKGPEQCGMFTFDGGGIALLMPVCQ